MTLMDTSSSQMLGSIKQWNQDCLLEGSITEMSLKRELKPF
jgi:hypothetical protein